MFTFEPIEMIFMGFYVSPEGLDMESKKVEAIGM
jgi:hypothetical protein